MPREAPPPPLSHGNGPGARPARRPSRGQQASPGPGGPSPRGQIRRTMRRLRGRPSCRAGDPAAGHKGAREPRASQASGGDRGGCLRPGGARGHVRPRLRAPKGPQRAAGTGGVSAEARGAGRQREGPRERRSGEWELGGGRGAAVRPEIRGRAAELGAVGPPRGRGGALSAVLVVGWPRVTGAPRARGRLCPDSHLPGPRGGGPLASCHGNEEGLRSL